MCRYGFAARDEFLARSCETFILQDDNGTPYLRTLDSPPLVQVKAGALRDSLGREFTID
jgi:hypothetical protein